LRTTPLFRNAVGCLDVSTYAKFMLHWNRLWLPNVVHTTCPNREPSGTAAAPKHLAVCATVGRNFGRTTRTRPSVSGNIFHYVYAVLHHPTYRERYAANLRRELPRIPFVQGTGATESRPDGRGRPSPREHGGPKDDKAVFWAFVEAGERLADLHVNYEKQPEYPLKRTENGKLDWRVQKMRLGKDKTSLVYNSFLTLSGIPPETYEYRLGNRSALEWVVDQYQVSTDKRSGIVNDPNRADDPEYIVRLIGQVVTVSMETVEIVKALPELVIGEARAAGSSE